MASSESSLSQVELAMCRLVEETTGHDTIKFLGPGCLSSFASLSFFQSTTSGTPNFTEAWRSLSFRTNSDKFLVASNQVLTKSYLRAIENREKEKSKKHKTSVKVLAEFPGTKDRRSLERKPLSELYNSLEHDVFEVNGIIYISLTKLPSGLLRKSSLLNRTLQAIAFNEETVSSILASDQLQCLVFRGESTRTARNAVFDTRAYDLLQFDSVLAGDDEKFPKYFLRSDTSTRFFKEDEFEEGEKPLGAVVVTKDSYLAGFLNFCNKNPVPVLIGIDSGLETNMGSSACENTYRSIVTRGGGVALPPENAETMQHSKMTRGLPVGASAGGVYPLLEPGLSSESQVGVDGGDKTTADNTDHLTETASAPVEEIREDEEKMLPDEGLETNIGSSASENTYRSIVTRGGGVPLPPETAETVQHSKITRGLPVGASAGGVYPLLGPGLSSESQVGVDGGDKTTTDNTDPLTETASAPVEEIVAHLNKTNLDETVPQKLFGIGGDEEKVLEEEELEANGRPSPTETSYQSFHVPESLKEKLTVDLPAKPHKEEPPRREITPDGFQPVATKGKVLNDALNNNRPKDTRRHTFPSLEPPKKEEHAKVKRCKSAMSRRLLEENTKINLSDPLSKTILDHLEILEGLSRSLDKEYKYGACKCWKHAAQCFGIEEQEYQSFKCKDIHSPTEVMFEYLQADSPETMIGQLKAGLRSIGRQDVIDVLIKYEQIMGNEGSDTLTDETFVSSLFDINPDVIGEMAFLLDMQKVGLKNWQDLAAQLGIPRKAFKSFETCNTTNPTEQLFELLKVHKPGLTIAELVRQLECIRRRDVIIAIKKSAKVTESSSMKDMMGDLNLMDEVCDMLNRKPRTNKVLGWRHLADRFGMDKDILDDLEPPQEDLECPTEALVRHLGSWKPYLKIADFIWALHKIARDDVFIVLDVYLPDRCIPNLLKACPCDRCQRVTDKSPADDAEEST